MAKPVRFAPRKTKAGSWRINIPGKYSESGKRERHFYPTRDKALEAASKIKSDREIFGTQTMAISPSLAEAAVAAQKLLEPLDIGLLDAVSRFVEMEKRNRASTPVKIAIAEFRNQGKEWSDSQARDYRLLGEKMIPKFSGRMISTITGEELRTFLLDSTNGPSAFNKGRALVKAIWNWCAKPPRKWCDAEAIEHLEKQAVTPGETGVLTFSQAEDVMRAAEVHYPESVPAFAIALFTGIRQAEIERLTPKDITVEGINIPAEFSKTKRRRFIKMPEPLAAWLTCYPTKDFVCPPNWQKKEKTVRRLAGFRVWSDLLPEPEPPQDFPEWPNNAFRHTAASMAVALGKPIERLLFEHGHSGGVELLKRHYLVDPEKSRFQAITR